MSSSTVRRTRSRSSRVATGADVRESGGGDETAAAEVEAVELDFGGRVGQGQRQHQGAQQGGLAGLRCADQAEVAVGAGQVGDEQFAELLERPVHHAQRDAQRALDARVAGAHAAVRVGHDAGQQLVQAGRLGQRGEPDLPGGRTTVLQPSDEDLQQAVLAAVTAVLLGSGAGALVAQGLLGERDEPGGLLRLAVRGRRSVPLQPEGGHLTGRGRPVRRLLGAGRCGRRSGDVGGLEPDEVGGVDLEVAVSGGGRQFVGAGGADHAARLHRGEGAQGEPV